MEKGALLSECKKYRYSLRREWKEEGLLFGYIGINPSTADADIDDATVRKWIGFTERNGGRGFMVGNVFAYRATDVKELRDCEDPVGKFNYSYLMTLCQKVDVIVPCWGNISKVPKQLRWAFKDVCHILDNKHKNYNLKSFGLSKSFHPKHPLMLGYDTQLEEFSVKEYKKILEPQK